MVIEEPLSIALSTIIRHTSGTIDGGAACKLAWINKTANKLRTIWTSWNNRVACICVVWAVLCYLTLTLVSDFLSINNPVNIAPSTVVSYTCGICQSWANGSLTWVNKTVYWMGTIRTVDCKGSDNGQWFQNFSIFASNTVPVRKLVSEGAAKVQCINRIRIERKLFMVIMMKQIPI